MKDYSAEIINKPEEKEHITDAAWLLPEEIPEIKPDLWLSLTDLINKYILAD